MLWANGMELGTLIVLGTAITLILLVAAGLVFTYVRASQQAEDHTAFRGLVDKLKATAASVKDSVTSNARTEEQLVKDVAAAKDGLRDGLTALSAAAGKTDAALARATNFSTVLDPNLDTSLLQVEQGYRTTAVAVSVALGDVSKAAKAFGELDAVIKAIPTIAPTAAAPSWATAKAGEIAALRGRAESSLRGMTSLLHGLNTALADKVTLKKATDDHAGWKSEWGGMQARLLALTGPATEFRASVSALEAYLNGFQTPRLRSQVSALGGASIDATQLCLNNKGTVKCIAVSKLVG